MARPLPKLAARRSVDKEMSEIGGVRQVRIGLATKFTIPVSLALSIVIILMGIVVYGSTADSLETQINQHGIFAARIAAAPEIDSWEPDYNTVENLQRRLATIDAALALASGQIGSGSGGRTMSREQKELERQITSHDNAQRLLNRRRLNDLLSQGALDVWIVKGQNALVASASGKTTHNYNEIKYFKIASSPETQIITGNYAREAGTDPSSWEPARFFRHPIKDRDNKEVGSATVVFSEKDLRGDLAALRTKIIVFCVIGVLTCAVVAFMSSKLNTQPLGALLKDIRTVAEGDLEHRTWPRSRDEIGTLAVAFDQMTKNLAAAEVMRVDLAEKDHQVSVAHEVQARLFPEQLPHLNGLALDASNRLSGELSGDLFDVVQVDGGEIGILVMSASGRGIPAAIVLSMARALFRSSAPTRSSPAETLKTINSLLSSDLRRGMYVSALYAVIDPLTGKVALASAGHRVPALHYLAATQGLKRVQPSGIAMGLDKGPVFDRSVVETTFSLGANDRLVLATEGAVMLEDEDAQTNNEESFMRVVLAACKQNVAAEAIVNALAKKRGDRASMSHDITLVTATRTSEAEPA